jgi:hypothetical protein
MQPMGASFTLEEKLPLAGTFPKRAHHGIF